MTDGDAPAQEISDAAVDRALELAGAGDDEAATQALLEILRATPAHFRALNELGSLALSRGYRSAARTAYRQAAACHPEKAIGRVNFGNVLLEDGDLAEARAHYEAALAIDPDFAAAHQGLGRVLAAEGDPRAWEHWRRGFAGHAVTHAPARGVGPAIPVLLLASAQVGNMHTRQWLDDRLFAVTVLHVEFRDRATPLPLHALIVNIVGDADLCAEALDRAQEAIDLSSAPVLNPPARVKPTTREENARRLAALPGVIAPRIARLRREQIVSDETLKFPLLLRSPGFHTGFHFVRVENRAALPAALASLPGEGILAIEYLDARGPDGMARKYRVMFIDGQMFPLHLAISSDWKVHYFSADMADDSAFREEERRFLEHMPEALGETAMRALERIGAEIGLDYFGIDFGLSADGSLLLFEANATMVVLSPPPEPVWDYRRKAVLDITQAAKRMALRRALGG